MTSSSGVFGARCLAMDDLGNRCMKDLTHADSGHGTERWHDASRGSLQRLWI